MNILAIDTSGNVCSVAVLNNNKILSEVYVDYKKTHSEMLAPMVDDCLKRVGLDIKKIDLYSCAIGPGSFTGLRIGASMVKAFSYVSCKPVLGINTLDALAQNVSGTKDIICPIIDAKRGDVYMVTYCENERISEYRAVQLDVVLNELHGKNAVFLGDAAINYKDKILNASASFRIAHSGIVLQRASSVGLIAYALNSKGVRHDIYEIEPFYLRETQAERVYAAKHGIKV